MRAKALEKERCKNRIQSKEIGDELQKMEGSAKKSKETRFSKSLFRFKLLPNRTLDNKDFISQKKIDKKP